MLYLAYYYTVRQSTIFYYQSLEATSQAVTTLQLCFDFVATVVHITLQNPSKFLFIDPVNTNTELDLLIRISCHCNLKSYCNLPVLVTILTHFHNMYKVIYLVNNYTNSLLLIRK